MMRNSLICKLINVPASMKENNEKNIKKEDEISKLIKAVMNTINRFIVSLSTLQELHQQPQRTYYKRKCKEIN